MKLQISTPALFVLQQLQKKGFEAYIVGGAVRDLIIQDQHNRPHSPKTDYDFATNAKPEEILAIFPESFYENDFGTVMITHQNLLKLLGRDEAWSEPFFEPDSNSSQRIIDLSAATKVHDSLSDESDDSGQTDSPPAKIPWPNYEITTYRTQESYSDSRRPDQLTWGKTIDEDVERRDFTINSLVIGVDATFLNHHLANSNQLDFWTTLDQSQFTLIDKFDGLNDLKLKIVKAVGDPTVRFQEDALRMLRAIRFAAELKMTIDPPTLSAITSHSQLIEKISWERIRDEVMKMLASPQPAEAIEKLDETGLLSYILPELQTGKGIKQGGHHTTDVWTHNLDALRHCPSPDPIVRLATLLHDIDKPATYQDRDGQITFYNHEILGSRTAKKIARRLRLSKNAQERIFTLVRFHMFHYQPHNTDAAIRRFMRKVGLQNIDDILDLREADRLGSGAKKTSWRLEEMKERMIDQLHQPLSVTDLAIDGHDIMTEFKLKPGPIIGHILQQLFEKVLENPELNSREKLLAEIKTSMLESSS